METSLGLKGVYLCARKHRIPGYDIDYNDIVARFEPDILTSCENVNLGAYDFIIATPPCNYWSIANYRRDISTVALGTRHLLPYCINSCIRSGRYFLVENVRNDPLFSKYNLLNIEGVYVYRFGHHTFWTNVQLDLQKLVPIYQNKQNVCRSKRDNNYNVHIVIDCFLSSVKEILNNAL